MISLTTSLARSSVLSNRQFRTNLVACLLVVALWLATALPAATMPTAGTRWMSTEQIRSTFIGKTLNGQYPSGAPWSDAYAEDGSIEYKDSINAWSGKWSFKGPTYCTWYLDGAEGGCFLVEELSSNCFGFWVVPREWDGLTTPDHNLTHWNGHGWVTDRPSTCEPYVGT